MRKKLALLLFALAALAPAAAVTHASPAKLLPTLAQTSTCPKGSHLFICPTYSFCCPNNAFCACLP